MDKVFIAVTAALFFTSFGLHSAHSASDRIVVANVGFSTPESVEYYGAEDVYLVTNINGDPFAADGNGFISKIKPDGSIVDLKWIDGAQAGITLHAPKGAEVVGTHLYVADRDQVHIFDLPSAKQLSSITIKGATFLNGITRGAGDSVYVTDSGFNPGFKPSGTDAVYQVWSNGNYQTIVRDSTMGGPNGIIAGGQTLTVVSFGSGAVVSLNFASGKTQLAKPPAAGLDGLLKLNDGRLLISSWGGSSIYVLNKDNSFSVFADKLDAPADMGFDPKRNRILVPLFKKNEVVFLPL